MPGVVSILELWCVEVYVLSPAIVPTFLLQCSLQLPLGKMSARRLTLRHVLKAVALFLARQHVYLEAPL